MNKENKEPKGLALLKAEKIDMPEEVRGKKLYQAIIKLCPFKLGDRVKTNDMWGIQEEGRVITGNVIEISLISSQDEPFLIYIKTSGETRRINSGWLEKIKKKY